jgi:hypothetical protein
MSDSGSQKSFRDTSSVDSTNSHFSGNFVINTQERKRPAVTYSSKNGSSPESFQKDISDAITKQAHAIQQAAARLQQHHNEQPIMAKKSNVSPQTNKTNTQTPPGMVHFNLVNENGVVTPIEINASMAAAAALVAAQKHQNHKFDGGSSSNPNSTSINNSNINSSFGNTPKTIDGGSKSIKSPHTTSGPSINVSTNFCMMFW